MQKLDASFDTVHADMCLLLFMPHSQNITRLNVRKKTWTFPAHFGFLQALYILAALD